MILAPQEWIKRRKKILQKIWRNSIAIIPTAPLALRNGDSYFHFRPNSDFYYITGFAEPDAVAVLLKRESSAGEFILFNRPNHKETALWEGQCAGQAQACSIYNADQSFPIEQFAQLLPELLKNKQALYYIFGINPNYDQIILNVFTQLKQNNNKNTVYPDKIIDLSTIVHELRLIKSPAEIKLLRKAADITSLAHKKAMQVCKTGMNEAQLEATIMYHFQLNGARFPAYNPIIGSGANSCILHYNANNKNIDNGSLVLIDAGAEYQYYASDVTRTFPANGKFSPEQRAIYQLVLATQLELIALITPGLSWAVIHQHAVKLITAGLVELGLLTGNVDNLIADKAYLSFYMHSTGHWLGLDTHDVGRYYHLQQGRKLKPGMVLTVEPGIYISSANSTVPKQWHNIGVRIEDEVVVTKSGCQVLSKNVPKTIAAIEQIMQRS